MAKERTNIKMILMGMGINESRINGMSHDEKMAVVTSYLDIMDRPKGYMIDQDTGQVLVKYGA